MAEIKNTKAFYNTEIPSDWDVKKLGKLGNVVSGLTYSPDDICEETGVLVLRSSNVQGGRITFDDNVFVKVKKGDFNPVKKNDILICVRNGSKSLIGKCALINEDAEGMAFGAFMAIFRGDYNEYLIHVFNTDIYNREIHRNLGATINSINGSDLKEFKIPLPPLPEQKAIARVLSTADVAIHTTEKLIAQKELRKKWLMQQLLTGKKRLKGFEGEWKEIHIRDVAKEVSIRNKSDKQLTVLSCTKYDGLVPSLEYFGRKIFADDVSTYKIVPKNHFAYATNHIEEGSIGYQEILEEALISPMYTVFKTDKTVNDDFFYKLLKSHPLVYQYQNRMEGSIDRRGGLRWDGFSIIKIKLPSLEEQTAIAQVLQAADKEISLLKAKAEKLREQKKGLMQQLLTGKVRLKINE
ncbi:MAG: restriction endonuclease subunit S [Bacteroidia bacterium]|nr:restriction endonuclease subunit S [Bacteroidia bacterium]